ncbi:M81 family metallopeptidase [Fredinandcohnia onubensis]|uniref:M81 family metallopeptidase n=1 Tax=Fredinandcohnia onubensis TaxID=1571209 RepID=UPI000C0BB9FC|nr:M81 family metallopeptidase [Fredinandcohnia onubensis]
MKIMVGCFYHETNTFNPFPTVKEDFVFVEGPEVLSKLGSTAILVENGVDVVPSIYATGLSSGVVTKETYEFFTERIVSTLRGEPDLDGIWLHLHGSMVVEGIGSGELALLKEIRKYVNEDIPISLTLDIHANIPAELSKLVNIVRAYRTVPHIDQLETEQLTAKYLIDYIQKGEKYTPSFEKLPLVICGEKALGNSYPLKDIFQKLEEIERLDGIVTASFFLGHAWSDSEHTGASIFVVPETAEFNGLASKIVSEMKDYINERQNDFTFSALALETEDAVNKSLNENVKPIFVSDSGDNTTAGATGFNTVLLRSYLSKQPTDKKVLISAIFDSEAYSELNQFEVGQEVSVEIGRNVDEFSEKVKVQGTLKAKGDLLGYLNASDNKVGDVCTISSGNVDIVVANRGESFITINHFTRAKLDLDVYDVIVLKQGYLFDELSKISKLDILAFTPGATYLNIKKLDYQNIPNGTHLV